MPNWCNTKYKVTGDSEDLKKLYDTMKELDERPEPLSANGFGKRWLGCLVDAFGGDHKAIWCRGDFSDVKMETTQEGLPILSFSTETAWGRAFEVEEFLMQKLPSLGFWFLEEEPGMLVYNTNDDKHLFFKECIKFSYGREESRLSEEAVVQKLSEILKMSLPSLDEALKAIDRYNMSVAGDEHPAWIELCVPQLTD